MKKLEVFESSLDYYKKFNRDSSSRKNTIKENVSIYQDLFGLLSLLKFIIVARKKGKININLLSGVTTLDFMSVCQNSSHFNNDSFNLFIRTAQGGTNDDMNHYSTYSSVYILVFLFLPIALVKALFSMTLNREASRSFGFVKSLKRYALFQAKHSAYTLIYKLCQSDVVHLIDSYSTNQAANYAAKTLGIFTVEIQHGIISKGHLGYNRLYLNEKFYPNKLILLADVFQPYVEILKLPFVDFEVSPLNYFGGLETQSSNEDGIYIIIGQPSISASLIDLYLDLKANGLNVKYKKHPREVIDEKIEVDYYTNNFYIDNGYYIGGFSTLLLELVSSGCNKVTAISDFIPNMYDQVLYGFGVNVDSLDDIKIFKINHD